MTVRPALSPALSGAELRRWYWTLAELTALAKTLGLPGRGSKAELTERLAAALDGAAVPTPPRRAAAGRQLSAPLSAATVIPVGQRCSQELRRYFRQQIGAEFVFDRFMRAFIGAQAGHTLADAVAHWHSTRAEAAREQPIGAQFEFNRFQRQWRRAHPQGRHEDMLTDWWEYRRQPADGRMTPA